VAISEAIRSWRDQRSNPAKYGDLGGLFQPGIRAANIQYVSRSSFRPRGIRMHEVQCDLSLPNGGNPHVTYYEPYPALHRLRGFSPIANRARTASSIRACLLNNDATKLNRALLAGELLGDIAKVIPDTAILTQREKELGKPENVVVVEIHGDEYEDGRWAACIQTDSLGLTSKDLGDMQDLIRSTIEHQHGNVDRIVIHACNPGNVDITTINQPHLRINYVHGDILEGFPESLKKLSPIAYMEFDSDTGKTKELTNSPL
jgi:hypothetical protein